MTAGNEMNLLDKAISIVAPRVALQRVRSRVALELTTGYLDRHAQRFRQLRNRQRERARHVREDLVLVGFV